MKKAAFLLCSQNLLKIYEYAVHKFSNPISRYFYFAHVIGNIAIISKSRAQVYKSYIHGHFFLLQPANWKY